MAIITAAALSLAQACEEDDGSEATSDERPVATRCGASPTGRGGSMCEVPRGTYPIGCSQHDRICGQASDRYDDEKPLHTVALSSFFVDQHEVSVEAYRECVRAGACAAPAPVSNHACNWGVVANDDHPINCVTWSNADAYCRWAGKRLPTEAEWEAAARGPTERVFPWGGDGSDYGRAVADLPSTAGTSSVCSKPEGNSPFGLCDMSGNVAEWVADWYAPDYYARSPSRNPRGPTESDRRGRRGGAWRASGVNYLRVSGRDYAVPRAAHDTTGFRCAWSPPTSSGE